MFECTECARHGDPAVRGASRHLCSGCFGFDAESCPSLSSTRSRAWTRSPKPWRGLLAKPCHSHSRNPRRKRVQEGGTRSSGAMRGHPTSAPKGRGKPSLKEARSLAAAAPLPVPGVSRLGLPTHGGGLHRDPGTYPQVRGRGCLSRLLFGKSIQRPSQSSGRVSAEWFTAEPALGGVCAAAWQVPRCAFLRRWALHPNTGGRGARLCLVQDASFQLLSSRSSKRPPPTPPPPAPFLS